MAAENKWQIKMTSAGAAIEYLFNNSILSDITFSCLDSEGSTQKILAHSFVLAMRSPVFFESLHASIGRPQEITIDDFSYETFLSFLRYLYGADFIMDCDNAPDLWKISHKYEVPCLTDEFIANANLTIENIFNHLELAVKVDNGSLKEKAIDFIGENGYQLMITESFNNLTSGAIKEILLREQEYIYVSETELFEYTIKWAEHQCKLNNYEVNPINVRRSLGDIVKLIRFTSMTSLEFAKCTDQYDGLLSTEEEISLVFNIFKKRDVYEHGFLKPREIVEVNWNAREEKQISFGFVNVCPFKYDRVIKTPCLSEFVVNTIIFMTNITCASPTISAMFSMQFGILIDIDNNKKPLMEIKMNGPSYFFKKPIKLLPGQRYYLIIVNEHNNNAQYSSLPKVDCPFTKTVENVDITFSQWSPLFEQIKFKQHK